VTARSTFSAASTAGPSGSKQQPTQPNANRGRWFKKTVTFKPAIVVSTLPAFSGVFLPRRAMIERVYLDTKVAEVTGLTKTINVGVEGISSLLTGTPVSTDSVQLADIKDTSLAAINTDGIIQITYTLGSDDWVEFDAEIIVEYTGTDTE